MTKKDYEAAALIVQAWCDPRGDNLVCVDGTMTRAKYVGVYMIDAFAQLFRDDNPRFDEARFRAACQPGAYVRARPRRREVA